VRVDACFFLLEVIWTWAGMPSLHGRQRSHHDRRFVVNVSCGDH
jgi:hypothetical protein